MESSEDLVKMPGGFSSRPKFTRTALKQLLDHLPAEITMTIELDESRRGRVWAIHLLPAMGIEPFDDPELIQLGGPGLVEARDELMKIELQEVTPDRGYSAGKAMEASRDELEALLARDEPAARESVKTARRRRQVTPEVLSQVLTLYDVGGIEAVVEQLNYSESYSWKLLRRARQEVAS
jgi:hypothetical protein